MTVTNAPSRPLTAPERGSLAAGLRAEWVKFRTVRGWLIGLAAAVMLCVVFTYLVANGNHVNTCVGNGVCQTGHAFVPSGPDGEAVADSYQFLTQPLTSDGALTAEVASLRGLISTNPPDAAPSITATKPGLSAWAKAGVLLTASTRQGAPYAAVMATGNHGIRFQYDYTHDHAGLPGAVTNSSSRWIRLTRAGDTITGYDSADGTVWHKIGTAHLAGLPATVDVGLFVTSPVAYQGASSGVPSQATGIFDHVTLDGATTGSWQSRSIGIGPQDLYPALGAGSARRSGDAFVLTGSGDIAPAVNLAVFGGNTASSSLLLGLIAGLIVLIVIAAMFITVEYRRGLIRTTFTATPQRGAVLTAKAVVIGAVAFVIGALAAAIAVPVGEHILTGNGNYVFPATAATVAGIVVGSGIVTALTAVAVLAVGTMLRRSAGAVTAGIIVFVLPSILGTTLSGSANTWLFRLTPAAAFSALGALPRSALVAYPYTFANGYYPLTPWAGLAVLCAYTVVALSAAALLLHRRDA